MYSFSHTVAAAVAASVRNGGTSAPPSSSLPASQMQSPALWASKSCRSRSFEETWPCRRSNATELECASNTDAEPGQREARRLSLHLHTKTVMGTGGLRTWWNPTRHCTLLGGFHEHRWMSGAAHQEQAEGRTDDARVEKAQLPTMEAHLRKLYMRVHPDLFSSHPEARDANEKSFQLLSEFLNVIKNQDGRGGVGKVFKLEFYMRPVAEPGEGDAAVSADLEQVSVSLRTDGSPRDKKKQLTKLFEACGIFGDFAFNAAGGGEGARGGESSGPASDLAVWIREHSHAAAVARRDHDRAWRVVYAQQHALQLWHKVRVSFAGNCATWSPDARAELLRQLFSDEVLATLQVQGGDQDQEQDLDINALRHVVLADSNSIHSDGRVTLASDVSFYADMRTRTHIRAHPTHKTYTSHLALNYTLAGA